MDQNPSPPLFVPEWAKRVYQSKEIKIKHYIVMNGSVGCIPDNTEIHDTIESAIDSILTLFDYYPNEDHTDEEYESMRIELREELADSHIFYFPEGYGADYVEIAIEECIGTENGCEYHDNE